jgi:PAS domain-containing protein
VYSTCQCICLRRQRRPLTRGAVRAGVCCRGMPPAPLDGASLTLALVEAQVGSLLDVLPVALLVTSPTGEILRANAAAIELLEDPALVGQSVRAMLEVPERESTLKIRVRLLRHEQDVLRLYVIHAAEG